MKDLRVDPGQSLRRLGCCAWLFCCTFYGGGPWATSTWASAAAVKTFDLTTYTEPRGIEMVPAGSDNHVSFRRVDPSSWIFFSVYGSRAASGSLAQEFDFDWKDLNGASGIAPPPSVARAVGQKISAREGGIFVPKVGYVDLVDVDAGDKVVAILIQCGSAEQFHTYQPVIDEFLASLAVAAKQKAGLSVSPASATTLEVDYVKDGFVWTGANGLEYVPALTTVARGAGFPASIPGIWQDDRQQFTLDLAEDGTYASAYAGAGASGSTRVREAGRWHADGAQLMLKPERASLYSRTVPSSRGEEVTQEFGGPRSYAVATLVLEYSRDRQTFRTDGLELKGPPAPWYYTPSGNFSIVLRRTGARQGK